jgi:starch phosphorylase
MEDHKKPFDLALTITRAGNLFTTHTAVPAGFDRFAPDLAAKYLSRYAEQLAIPLDDLLTLGRQEPSDRSEPFNMAYLAVRGSDAINAVSELHGHVSRRIFQSLFPRWPQTEVPVGYVTNGVHMPTWDSAASDAVWTEACGKRCWREPTSDVAENIRRLDDSKLWQLRTNGRRSMIAKARTRLARQLAEQGAGLPDGMTVQQVFDPDALMLGFARRFATYKRPNLLLHDPERLVRLLSHRERPVQLILAGKAHPQDQPGQAMIKQWSDFIQRPEVRSRVVFLSDYDMSLTQQLVQGVDVWINTPRRPWEACGTSGMKVLVNGGLNLSELDGWWAEAYTPEVGWAIGDRLEHGEDPEWDRAEADALYALLEQQVVPEFYQRDSRGVPVAWVARIRESMARLTPAFSASRAISEYAEKHYLPAASSFKARAADDGKLGAELLQWRRDLAAGWDRVRFGSVAVETDGKAHRFSVQLFLYQLSPDAVRVELYANPNQGEEPVREAMRPGGAPSGAAGECLYSAQVPASRPATDYTPRIIPWNAAAVTPLEAANILWQR